MSDFQVQHFNVNIPAGAETVDIAIPIAIDPAQSRVLPGSQTYSGLAFGAFSTLESLDYAFGIEIVDSTTVRLHSTSDRDHALTVLFDIVSHIGPSNGANAFRVLHRGSFDTSGSSFATETEINIAALGISTGAYAKLTAAITGITLNPGVGAGGNDDWALMIGVAFRDDELGDPAADRSLVFAHRGGAERTIYYEIIEWHGSNWQVERPNTGTGRSGETFYSPAAGASGAIESVGINDIGSWEHSWIEQSRTISNGVNIDGCFGSLVYPGADAETVRITTPFQNGGAQSTPTAHGFFVLSNPEILVKHQGEEYSGAAPMLPGTSLDLVSLADTEGLNGDPSVSFVRANGFWENAPGGHATVGHDEPTPATGNYNMNGLYLPPERVILVRSEAGGYLYGHLQVVQLARFGSPDATLLQSVVDVPRFSVDFQNR